MSPGPTGHIANASPDPFTPEQRQRHERWQAELARVFGNTTAGNAWAYGYHKDFRGGREQPAEVAPRSEEGFADCVAFLDSIAHTITPQPGPDFDKIRARRRRR